jgi:hypothetical protein
MNPTALKTALLTIASLSLFTICLIELSGISKTALINKFKENELYNHNKIIYYR